VAGLGGFDNALIDEASALAKRLREQSAGKLVGEPASAQKAALELRNRIATLLCARMTQVRSAARFVFRGRLGRDGPFGPPPEQIRTCGFPASGSHLRSTGERTLRADGRE